MSYQKRFYTRETNTALDCINKKISYIPLSPSLQLKYMINPFLSSKISARHEKVEEFNQSSNLYTLLYCFSIVESLFFYLSAVSS